MFRPYFRIDLAEISKLYREEKLLKVIPTSPLSLRKEVERIAYYFQRELHFDFPQFTANDKDPYTAYLFRSRDNVHPPVWVGACCFRIRNDNQPVPAYETLQWIWMHPYSRNQGILTEVWSVLRRNHSKFIVEEPISHAMAAFLLKQNKKSRAGRRGEISNYASDI